MIVLIGKAFLWAAWKRGDIATQTGKKNILVRNTTGVRQYRFHSMAIISSYWWMSQSSSLSFISLKVQVDLPDKNGRFRYKDGISYYFPVRRRPGNGCVIDTYLTFRDPGHNW